MATQASGSVGAVKKPAIPSWRGWLIFSAPTFLFVLVQGLRNVLSSNADVVEHVFSVGATSFAVASGIYFFFYAPSQLASGLFVDWIGSRFVLAGSAVLCALSMIMLATGSTMTSLSMGRAVSGIASGVPLLVAIYLASIWLPEQRLPIATGLANGFGALGSFFAIWLLPLFIASTTWSTVMLCFGGIWIFGAVLVLVLVPKRPDWAIPRDSQASLHKLGKGIIHVLSIGRFWILVGMGTLIVAPIGVLGGLWGTHYLEKVRNWGVNEASFAAAVVFLGFTAGSILSGFIGERRLLVRMVAIGSGLLTGVMTLLLLFMDEYSVGTGTWMMFLAGFGTGGVSLMYALVARISGPTYRATGTALILFPTMVFTGVVQAVSGWMIDNATARGANLQSAFNEAFAMTACLSFAATILGIFGVVHAILRGNKHAD